MAVIIESQPPKQDQNRHNLALDGWRGIACLLVLFYHTGANLVLPPLVIYGFIGVHLFFVLSGYLLFQPFLDSLVEKRPAPSTLRFYIRRFMRIYPPYLVALLVFIVLRYLSHTKPPTNINLIEHVVLLFNYFDPRNFFSINPVFWSLAIEAQFYVVLPLGILLISRLCHRRLDQAAWVVPIMFILVGIVSRSIEAQSFHGVASNAASLVRFRSVFSYLDLFGFGMLVAYLRHRSKSFTNEERVRPLALVTLGFIIILGAGDWSFITAHGDWLASSSIGYTVGFPVLLCAGIALILFAIVISETAGKMLSSNILVKIGQISYSIYLYHVGVQFFVYHFIKLNPHMNYREMTYLYGFISLFPTLAVAAAMYLLVEKPALNWAAKQRYRRNTT